MPNSVLKRVTAVWWNPQKSRSWSLWNQSSLSAQQILHQIILSQQGWKERGNPSFPPLSYLPARSWSDYILTLILTLTTAKPVGTHWHQIRFASQKSLELQHSAAIGEIPRQMTKSSIYQFESLLLRHRKSPYLFKIRWFSFYFYRILVKKVSIQSLAVIVYPYIYP